MEGTLRVCSAREVEGMVQSNELDMYITNEKGKYYIV